MATDSLQFVLGRYRIGELIAAGGTARVHRAHDVQLDRPVAVKLLHPHLLPDESARRRFAAEARAAAGLRHPAIVTVYDVAADAEAPAIVMELVEGESLSALLTAGGAMPPRDVARIGAEVADALYLAHRQGVVHRDVKPGNILIERGTGRARLVDFGIAHSLAAGGASLTQTGTSLGTPRYMAPEQLAGEALGPRTDLWGLGAAMYEALAGRPPYDAATPLAIARQQQAGPPALEGVDAGLAAIVATCLAPRVEDRPLHAGALAGSLRGWRDAPAGETTLAIPAVPPVGPATAATAVPSAAGADTSSALETGGPPVVAVEAPTRTSRRPPAALLAAVVAASALLGVVLAAGAGRGVAQDPASSSPSPLATPDWRAPLLAAYRDACQERLDASEIRGLSPDEAESLVDGLIADCQDAAADAGSGSDRENGGSGKGNGKGKGKGRGR
jgi:serine/threonine-protein kinase